LHPCGMIYAPQAEVLFVANANSDSVSVIDTKTDEVVETIACRPEARLPFGSGPNALALSPDAFKLYVANGTNNGILVVELSDKAAGQKRGKIQSAVVGLIPAGWYPGAILVSRDGQKLFVANIKGHGSLSQPRPAAQGHKSRDHLGTVSIIEIPDREQLAK